MDGDPDLTGAPAKMYSGGFCNESESLGADGYGLATPGLLRRRGGHCMVVEDIWLSRALPLWRGGGASQRRANACGQRMDHGYWNARTPRQPCGSGLRNAEPDHIRGGCRCAFRENQGDGRENRGGTARDRLWRTTIRR